MIEDQKLLPVEEPQKLLDRPAEERLREELDHKSQNDGHQKKPAPEKPKPSKKWLLIALLIGLVALALIFLLGYLPRRSKEKATQKAARREEESIPTVDVAKVKRSPGVTRLLLPGNITPITEAPIYARATGYIIKRYVDIGDRVRANQLMAVIEAPELDQQVAQGRSQLSQARQQLGQAEAALQQAEAQLELAKVTWNRYAILVQHGAVAKQDADTQKANYDTAGANVSSSKANVRASEDNVKAAQANLERLISLQSYKEIRSPFAGVVTVRNVDLGSYISTAGGQSGSTTYASSQQLGSNATAPQNAEMFRVAQIGRLRILINVPQSDASSVHIGQHADVLVNQSASRPFPGVVTRTASSLDPNTRTLLTEVQVENSAMEMLPGMYAQVQFSSDRSNPPLLVPGDSLITLSGGVFIATLRDPDPQKLQAIKKQSPEDNGTDEHKEKPKQIHLKRVDVGRDYGTDTEITAGLEGWEYVATNPSDEVYEGALVLPTSAAAPQSATPAGGQTDKRPNAGGGDTSAGGGPSTNTTSGATGGGGSKGGGGKGSAGQQGR